MKKTLIFVLSSMLLGACGDDSSSTMDASTGTDARVESDAGGDPDAGDPDAGGESDVGPTDSGGIDAGAEDAGSTEDGGPSDAGSDAGPPADAGPQCLFNTECPDETACTGVGDGESYCIPGPRGTTPYGEACTESEQCASAVCLEDFCTIECDDPDICSSENLPRCHPALGYCTPPPGG